MHALLGALLLLVSFLAFTLTVVRLKRDHSQSVYIEDLILIVIATVFHIMGAYWLLEIFRPLQNIHKVWVILSICLIVYPAAQIVNLRWFQCQEERPGRPGDARYCLWDCLAGCYTAHLVSVFMWLIHPWWPATWLAAILVTFAWVVYVLHVWPAHRVERDLIRLRAAWWIVIATGANTMAAIMVINVYGRIQIWGQLAGAISFLATLIWLVMVLRIIYLRQLDYELVGGRLQIAKKQLAHSVMLLIFIYTIAASVAVVTLVSV